MSDTEYRQAVEIAVQKYLDGSLTASEAMRSIVVVSEARKSLS